MSSILKIEHQIEDARDRELAQRGLPEIAFIDVARDALVADHAVVAVRRGLLGYYAVESRLSADELNKQQGITENQRKAMLAGSIFGWHVPAAHPDHWRHQ